MKTVTSTIRANDLEAGPDFTYLVAYSDGTSETLKKSIIDIKAGTGGQNSIDRATANKELSMSVKTMIEAI